MLRFIPKQREPVQIPPELSALPVPRRLLELLVERGIDTPQRVEEYLHPDKALLHDPMRMQDMDRAVAVIRESIARGDEIIVFGDYDVDGVTATAILLTYLRKQGAKAGRARPVATVNRPPSSTKYFTARRFSSETFT